MKTSQISTLARSGRAGPDCRGPGGQSLAWLPDVKGSVARAMRLRQHAAKAPYPSGGHGKKRSREDVLMSEPRISYVDPATVKDPAMIAEFERCAREVTPDCWAKASANPSIQAVE